MSISPTNSARSPRCLASASLTPPTCPSTSSASLACLSQFNTFNTSWPPRLGLLTASSMMFNLGIPTLRVQPPLRRMHHLNVPSRPLDYLLAYLWTNSAWFDTSRPPRLDMSWLHPILPTSAQHFPAASGTSCLGWSHPGHIQHSSLVSACLDNIQHILATSNTSHLSSSRLGHTRHIPPRLCMSQPPVACPNHPSIPPQLAMPMDSLIGTRGQADHL